MSKLEELEKKIDKLDERRIAYLEIDKKGTARRIKKQIEMLELEIEMLAFNKIKTELKIYKEVISDYPELFHKVQQKLKECA